jgi:hypothetical protein
VTRRAVATLAEAADSGRRSSSLACGITLTGPSQPVNIRPPNLRTLHLTNVFFFRKKKDDPSRPAGRTPESGAPAMPRPMLKGVVSVGGREWTVTEEKRQGPRPQILILRANDAPTSEMHVRPIPGSEAKSLEEVELLAADPTSRWLTDAQGLRWEIRLVVPDPPTCYLVKFISWQSGVFEGAYPFSTGLGHRTDDDLRRLLADLRTASD